MNYFNSLIKIRVILIGILFGSLIGCFELPDNKFDVQIHWQPVTEYTNGSDISSIDHYQIHYGDRIDQLDNIVISRNSNITSTIINDLSEGSYYFAMVAVDSHGEESELSQPYYFEVNK